MRTPKIAAAMLVALILPATAAAASPFQMTIAPTLSCSQNVQGWAGSLAVGDSFNIPQEQLACNVYVDPDTGAAVSTFSAILFLRTRDRVELWAVSPSGVIFASRTSSFSGHQNLSICTSTAEIGTWTVRVVADKAASDSVLTISSGGFVNSCP
jgi:hypothetical protein